MSASCRDILEELLAGRDLPPETAAAAMAAIFAGEWSAAQIAAFLVALRAKGERPAEIAAAARVMRENAAAVDIPDPESLLDCVGTGGDGARTFNISTAAAIIAAAAGARVAKHGNRAVSGACGSSDALAAAGARLDLPPAAVAECVAACRLGFMFAPNHHPAMRHAAPVRRDLGVRTLFNLLGPLSNPARAGRMLLGVFDPALLESYAQTLVRLGCRRALIVHGGGCDEVALHSETRIADLNENGEISFYAVAPEQFGIDRAPLAAIQVSSPEQAQEMLGAALADERGAARDAAALNGGAAIFAAGLAPSLAAGVDRARETLASGAARQKLADFVAATARFAPAA